MALGSPCSPSWPGPHDSLASASRVLGLEDSRTTPGIFVLVIFTSVCVCAQVQVDVCVHVPQCTHGGQKTTDWDPFPPFTVSAGRDVDQVVMLGDRCLLPASHLSTASSVLCGFCLLLLPILGLGSPGFCISVETESSLCGCAVVRVGFHVL